ncbi:MAG: hypothetical protein IT384_22940 [Deltaproteobacteria bacterium]|nr:hypothetical protein [Deltaproteobacteria bacterium]
MATVPVGSAKKATSASASAKVKKAKKPPLTAAAVSAKAKKLVEVDGPKAQALDDADIPSVFPLDALTQIKTRGPEGVTFRLDSGFLDALRLQVRRIVTPEGKPGFSLEMKIAGPSRRTFEDQLEKKGATRETFEFVKAELDKRGNHAVLAQKKEKHPLGAYYSSYQDPHVGDEPDKALRMTGINWVLDFVPTNGPIAVRGLARIQLTGTDAECGVALKDVIQKAGLQPAFAPPTKASIRRYAMMKLLWRLDPGRARSLSKQNNLSSLKLETVEEELKKKGVSEARIKGLRYEEVAPGHYAVIDPAAAEEMIEAGLRYAYSTVTDPEHVHGILRFGQKATLTRWSEGKLIEGMSSMADVGSGGAQGVFSRLVTDAGHDQGWTGRTYKIILKPELLSRLDIWGWSDDRYGQSWDLSAKNFGPKLLKDVGVKPDDNYQDNNEIVSPVGNGPQYIAAVVATSAHDRTRLLTYLKKQGYKPPHGKNLEKMVILAESIKANLLGGAAPKKKDYGY